MDIKKYITSIPDFPKKGITFRDITTLIANGDAFSYAVDELASYAKEIGATVIAGPEARGFIFGAPAAANASLGFIPIRKPFKLPREVNSVSYELEYGKDILCCHKDALKKGDKVLIIDDLLATGGTALAACKLVEMSGAEVAGFAFVIDLVDLKGREKLKGYKVKTLVEFEGE